MSSHRQLFKLILSAMFLALALVLPFLTGQIPQIGNMLCPMHLPVLLAGFFCGPVYAMVIGFVAPLLRFLLFGMPVLMPTGIAMAFELAAYGFFSGLLYRLLPKKIPFLYVSLLGAMIIGRIISGVANVILSLIQKSEYGFSTFITASFVKAVPGILLQIVLIPLIVMGVHRAFPKMKDSL